MVRRFVPFALLTAILIGCAKKQDDAASGNGNGGGEPTPTGPAYTIKLREEQAGDKWAVTQSGSTSVTNVISGSKGKQTNTTKEPFKTEFIETILEKPA